MPSRLSSPAASAGQPLVGLVAVVTLVALELVRAGGPLVDTAFGQGGASAAVRAAVVTYAAPGLVAALLLLAVRRAVGPAPVALLLGSGLLAVLRLGVQGLTGDARFVLGLAAVAVALAVLVLAVAVLAARPGGGRYAAAAVLTGAAGGVGLQLALGTWDASWRPTPLGWSVAVALTAALVLLAVLVAGDRASSPTQQVGRLWALGPALALAVMMLANPAFAAAQSGLPLALAGPVHGAGLLLAGGLLARSPRSARISPPRSRLAGRWGSGLAALGLVAGVAVALELTGSRPLRGFAVLVALLTAQLTTGLLLGRALEPGPPRTGQVQRNAPSLGIATASAAAAGLLTIVPVLLYQLDYDVPLGFPNELVLVATAVLLAAAGLRGAAGGAAEPVGVRPPLRLPPLLAAALLLLGTVATAVSGLGTPNAEGEAGGAAYTGRIVSWNLHYGVTPAGAVDLEAVARTLEAYDPDVVLLQEVSRGWVQGGGVDMASWLSARLGRSFVFGPAADGRFGNAILARGRLSDVEVLPLPYGAGPQRRSAITAVTRLGPRPTRVTSIHLQHRAANSATRVAQVQTFLDAQAARASTVSAQMVGGDLNATRGLPEVGLLTGAGFTSAVDSVGDPDALTDPSTGPTRRIAWVFGRGIRFTRAEVLNGGVLRPPAAGGRRDALTGAQRRVRAATVPWMGRTRSIWRSARAMSSVRSGSPSSATWAATSARQPVALRVSALITPWTSTRSLSGARRSRCPFGLSRPARSPRRRAVLSTVSGSTSR